MPFLFPSSRRDKIACQQSNFRPFFDILTEMVYFVLVSVCYLLNQLFTSIWFPRNDMKRNSSNYQVMVLGKDRGTDEPVFECNESQLPISNTTELLDIDGKLNFEKHMAKICRKVSQKIAVLKRMQKLLPLKTWIFMKFSFYHTVPKRGTSLIRSQLTSQRWWTNERSVLFSEISPRFMKNFVSLSVSQVFVNND